MSKAKDKNLVTNITVDVRFIEDLESRIKELEEQNKEMLNILIDSTKALKEKMFIQKMDEVCESFIGFGLMPKKSQPEEGSICDIIEKQIEANEALINKLATGETINEVLNDE